MRDYLIYTIIFNVLIMLIENSTIKDASTRKKIVEAIKRTMDRGVSPDEHHNALCEVANMVEKVNS